MSELSTAAWRTSSFSNGTGGCVEVALLDDGRTAVRNSNHPEAGVVLFTRAEMDAYIKGVKAGEFDDLA
jgi:SH3-like domain-containing protein